MRRVDALYNWPMQMIETIAASDETANFAEELEGQSADDFVNLAESINGFSTRLRKAKTDTDFFGDWSGLNEELGRLADQFGEYRPDDTHKLRVFCVLAAKMADIADEVTEDQLDDEIFEIRTLSFGLPVPWLSYENGVDVEGAAFLLNMTDLDAISLRLEKKAVTEDLLYYFLQEFSHKEIDCDQSIAMIRVTPEAVDDSGVNAFVRLILLSFGEVVHETVRYSEPLSLIDPNVFRVEHVYQQWNEVIDVISEYNSHNDLLTKYLVIYHVVENLMFKVPIVKLQREKAGKMFSIRDFQRLYRSVEEKEGAALKALLTVLMAADIGSGVTFEDRLKDRWNNITGNAAEQQQISQSLKELGVRTKSSEISFTDFSANGQFADRLAKLIYAVRCAVVHNKETELHLTHSTLDTPSKKLIKQFLIPSLEEMCFFLVGTRNTDVWYLSQNLVLYK